MLTSASFRAMGAMNVVVVDEPAALGLATATARRVIEAIDAVGSRFRTDSEISRVNRSGGLGPIHLSDLLNDMIAAALDAASATDGLVDPTIGALMERAGYTVTFTDIPSDGPAIDLEIRSAPGWTTIEHDWDNRTVSLPESASLDLGAVGKAWAADQAAHVAAERVGSGVLVECGGDVAVSGPTPNEGWCVRVAVANDAPAWQDVRIFDGGLATSGTETRTWRRGGEVLHHIIYPSTGLPEYSPWLMARVAAESCAEANAAATAAIVLGERAVAWLGDLGVPARLVRRDGSVVLVGLWPAQD